MMVFMNLRKMNLGRRSERRKARASPRRSPSDSFFFSSRGCLTTAPALRIESALPKTPPGIAAAVRLRFADFELDVEKRILYRHGLVQRVQPKVLDTLILLVEARGKILTKEELIQALWPNAVVEEGGLARNISILRKLLGEGSATPPIQTIPRSEERRVGKSVGRGGRRVRQNKEKKTEE